MNKKWIAAFAFSLTLIACGRDETAEPPAETTTVEQAGTSSPSDIAPTTAQSWLDDVTIGHELSADGSIVTGRGGDDFAPGQPIHIAIETGDAPPAAVVKVVWYGPNETKINEENKPVVAGQKYLNFTDGRHRIVGQGRLPGRGLGRRREGQHAAVPGRRRRRRRRIRLPSPQPTVRNANGRLAPAIRVVARFDPASRRPPLGERLRDARARVHVGGGTCTGEQINASSRA
jgi:hypothetical protein